MVFNDFFFVLREIIFRKYKIRVIIVFFENYKIDIIVLFDIGVDFNCIKFGFVLKCFYLEIKEKLFVVNNFKFRIIFKVEVLILKENIFIKIVFVFTDDIY